MYLRQHTYVYEHLYTYLYIQLDISIYIINRIHIYMRTYIHADIYPRNPCKTVIKTRNSKNPLRILRLKLEMQISHKPKVSFANNRQYILGLLHLESKFLISITFLQIILHNMERSYSLFALLQRWNLVSRKDSTASVSRCEAGIFSKVQG